MDQWVARRNIARLTQKLGERPSLETEAELRRQLAQQLALLEELRRRREP